MSTRLHRTLFGLVPRRERLVAAARGNVLELGGGLNVSNYRDVERVVVVEPDAGRRVHLLEGVTSAPVLVEVHEVDLVDSALADESFDTAVLTFVLCRAKDPASLLAAVRRLLRPDGRLLFLEHVRAAGVRGALQGIASVTWSRVFDGCRPDNDAAEQIRDAGFLITDIERFPIRLAAPAVRPGVIGTARKAVAA